MVDEHFIPAGMIVCAIGLFAPGGSQIISVGIPYYLAPRDSIKSYEDLLATLRKWFPVPAPNEADVDILLNITPGAEFVSPAKMTAAMIPEVLSDATLCDHVYFQRGRSDRKPAIYLSKGVWPMAVSSCPDYD
ncbi:hypothetical protein K440DRAFT_663373 [Wilcoxina mikolae CBS 423.85]|nr:hypothetical protein K440DRAFT_663373 [Wilcoxina mikolae CBS 423.85]